MLCELRGDVLGLAALESFKPSGLTSRQARKAEHEPFGQSDRRVCVLSQYVGGDRNARLAVGNQLEQLRDELQSGLGRELTLAEEYYSLSGVGTYLSLHLDEHHEATKHTPPSDAAHRRSVSFLLYLSDASSFTGGALRAYHRANVGSLCQCGAHEGNLQIGWLEHEAGSESEPVFLDAWVPPSWMSERSAAELWHALRAAEKSIDAADDRFYEACQPCSQLYTVKADGTRTHLAAQPIEPNDPEFAGVSLEADEFVERLRGRLCEPFRDGFSGLTHRHAQQRAIDIDAVGGTLVLFDSVCVPHRVLPVTAGHRLALGGWFHEPSQPYAAWYDSAFEQGGEHSG